MNLSLDQIKNNITAEIQIAAELAQEFAAACTAFAERDHAYRKAQSIAMLGIVANCAAKEKKEPTADVKRAQVDKECEIERLYQRLAQANKEGLKARLETCNGAITALQSLLKAELREADLTKYS